MTPPPKLTDALFFITVALVLVAIVFSSVVVFGAFYRMVTSL